MENEEVFTATANIDALSQNLQSAHHRGHDAAMVAAGGIEIPDPHQSESERSPLLGRPTHPHDPQTEEPTLAASKNDDSWIGDGELAQRPWWNRPSIYWLLPVFLLTTLSFGGAIVPKINLILGLICDEYFSERLAVDPNFQFMPVILGSDNPQCQTPEVQSRVSRFTLYGNIITALLSAVTSPKIGALSDKYGRTKVLASIMVGSLLSEVIFILAATFPAEIPVQWLFLGYCFDGLCGSFTAAMAVTHAYSTDCTPPSKRNVVFGYFHGCLFTGIGLGPIIAGYIVKTNGNIITIFYVALACHCFYFLYVLLVVPDSLPKAKQLVARQKRTYVEDAGGSTTPSWITSISGFLRASNLFGPLAVLYPSGEGSSSALRRNVVLLAAVDTIMFGVAMGSITVVIIYSEFIFHWGTFESSVFVSVVNSSRVFVLLILLPLVSRIVRGPRRTAIRQSSGSDRLDLSIIKVAIFSDLLGYIGYITSRSGNLFILAGSITSLGAMGSPTLQAALTNHVPTEKVGQVLGAMGLLHALARLVGPTIFNLLYSVTVGSCPQTVFIALAAVFGIAFVLSWFIRPYVHWDAAGKSKANPQADDGAGEVEVI